MLNIACFSSSPLSCHDCTCLLYQIRPVKLNSGPKHSKEQQKFGKETRKQSLNEMMNTHKIFEYKHEVT